MIRGIDHIELIVRDVEEFVAFFERMGFKVLTRTSHHGSSAELQLPGENQPIFEIHQVGGEENIGVNHIAFKVDNAQGPTRNCRAKD
jgi:catechol 2,3-dioxygenase-like lactoylglutathione lyase family enzyme